MPSVDRLIKPARKGDIASDYQVCHEMPGHVSTEQKDVAWSLARMDLSKVVGNVNSHVCENQKMPTWSAFNSVVTDEQMPEQTVGLLPYYRTLLNEMTSCIRHLRTSRMS